MLRGKKKKIKISCDMMVMACGEAGERQSIRGWLRRCAGK
jgi:hypothetical protein